MSAGPSSGPSALADAVNWAADLLLGTVGTSFAVLAIAGIGLALMSGRLQTRRAGMVVIGIFVLVGAPAIARALVGLTGQNPAQAPRTADQAAVLPATMPTPPPYDPYAGASVPGR
jgi:type IV secretory pathway VirB2 component (pilin)